jgi:hypothetical protein
MVISKTVKLRCIKYCAETENDLVARCVVIMKQMLELAMKFYQEKLVRSRMSVSYWR